VPVLNLHYVVNILRLIKTCVVVISPVLCRASNCFFSHDRTSQLPRLGNTVTTDLSQLKISAIDQAQSVFQQLISRRLRLDTCSRVVQPSDVDQHRLSDSTLFKSLTYTHTVHSLARFDSSPQRITNPPTPFTAFWSAGGTR
jgi:hypothetical protein